MPLKPLLSLTLLILLAGLLAACSAAATPTPAPTPEPTATAVPTATAIPTATPTPQPEPFRMGFLYLRMFDQLFNDVAVGSGDGPVVRSVLLAVKHVNDAGGVFGQPVEYHFRGDAPAELPRAVANATELLDVVGVHAFIGPPASVHLIQVGEALAKPRRIPFVSQSNAPSVAHLEDDGFVFRTSISDLAQGQALAALAEEEGFDHVALVHRDTLWGRDLAEVFKTHFAGKVTEVSLHPEQDRFAAELHQISASNAPALVILTNHEQAVPVLAEVAEHGHFEEFLLTADLRSLPFLEQWPELLDGAKGVAPIGKHVTEAEGHWEADYAAAFGMADHGTYMRESYDAALALMVAAEYAGSTDGTALRDALRAVGNPPGQRFPASAEGVKGALEAVRNGQDIDLEGEATDLNWDDRGEIVLGHISVWQYQDGEIRDLEHFDVDLSQ